MTLIELGQLIGKFAPLIGSVLPIPGGVIIGELVANLFGGNISNIPDLASKITNDTDAKTKLMELEQNHQEKMKELLYTHSQNELNYQAQLKSLEVNDRIDARKNKDWIVDGLAILITFGFFGIMAIFVFLNVSDTIETHLSIMLGNLGTAWAGVVAFYFGSSAGSRRKDEILSRK